MKTRKAVEVRRSLLFFFFFVCVFCYGAKELKGGSCVEGETLLNGFSSAAGRGRYKRSIVRAKTPVEHRSH